MSIPGSASPLFLAATGAAGYDIERSLRFNDADASSLTRTPSSAGNRKTFTFSTWIKTSEKSSQYFVSNAASGATSAFSILHQAGNFVVLDSSITGLALETEGKFRDPSAWYHLVVAVDTTQATANDRVKIYINGEIAALGYAVYPNQNAQTTYNDSRILYIGAYYSGAGSSLNGYLADIHSIDGQALAPTDFGEYDTNNVWQPKEYSGSYGTNGFHLDFSDNSSVAALGTDTSGSSNTFTVNNISVTAGTGNDSLRDSPVNGDATSDTGVGGEISSNYATLSAVHSSANSSISEGGLHLMGATGNIEGAVATIAMTHKTYWETKIQTSGEILTYHGIIRIDSQPVSNAAHNSAIGIDGTTYPNSACVAPGAYSTSQAVYYNGSIVYSTGAIWAGGDVIGHAYDPATGKYYVWRNGTALNSGNAVATLDTSYTYAPAVFTYQGQYNRGSFINFGQGPFTYGNAGTNRADASYKCLCTSNLTDPTIADGSTAMNVALWRGNATARDIDVNHRPGLVWIKFRSGDFGTLSHYLYDSNRGANKSVSSNDTTVEVGSYTNQLTAFNSNGFSLGVDTGGAVNYSGGAGTNIDYVGWSWAGGYSTVANTDGTISSQVSANPSAGFSIVTYTGNATSGSTVGHGLNAEPEFIICKNRSAAANWVVYSKALGASNVIFLNLANAVQAGTNWASTTPTSSVFSIGANSNENGSGNSQLAYCFAPVSGYSSLGSFTGNGSTDGPFVYTGFRPRWILIKTSARAADWFIYDTERDSDNVAKHYLTPDYEGAEVQFDTLDIFSNGFKLRTNGSSFNANTDKVIYAAFAEHPFKTARAR